MKKNINMKAVLDCAEPVTKFLRCCYEQTSQAETTVQMSAPSHQTLFLYIKREGQTFFIFCCIRDHERSRINRLNGSLPVRLCSSSHQEIHQSGLRGSLCSPILKLNTIKHESLSQYLMSVSGFHISHKSYDVSNRSTVIIQ